MPETIVLEAVVSTFGPLAQVNVVISVPSGNYGGVACSPGLTLWQKMRLLRAAKKQINAELYEVYKTLQLVEQTLRM